MSRDLRAALQSGRGHPQVYRPLLVALAATVLSAVTVAQWAAAGLFDGLFAPNMVRYVNNGLCQFMIAVAWMLVLYGVLQYLGVRHDQRTLRGQGAAPPSRPGPPGAFLTFLTFLAGRTADPAAASYLAPGGDPEALSALRRQLVWEHLEPLRFGVWALPILGFMGTVIGISGAIEGLEGLMSQSSGIVGNGFGAVTADLYYAFDTTLVGLVLMLTLALLYSLVRSAEHRVDTLLAHAGARS